LEGSTAEESFPKLDRVESITHCWFFPLL